MNMLRAVCGGLALAVLYSSCVFAQVTEIYEYDELRRLKQVTTDAGDQVDYAYDPVGNRTQHDVSYVEDRPVYDSIPTLGVGPNLISLANWPVGSAPGGAAVVSDWTTATTFSNETRWARVTGPGQSQMITAMEAGQTEADANGGGASSTNYFTIDETKAYEFTLYFKKYDTDYQNLYFGTRTSSSVKYAHSNVVNSNPYFLAANTTSQATYFDENKWYKVVAYVLPEGYPLVNNADWGGIYDVETGTKVANVVNFRWNEDRVYNDMYTRFFTYYYEDTQNKFTTYFYQPTIRVTDITYTPVVPALSLTHSDASEGNNISFTVNLDQATTVDVKVDYATSNGTASSGDYTATSGTLVIPAGQTSGTITVATTEDSVVENNETVVFSLTSPVRATLSETSESAYINNDDFAPSFSVNNVSVSEGGSLSFTVTASGGATLSSNVSYATANNTAGASDYTAVSGTLTFPVGTTSKTVVVSTTEDSYYENSETLYLNLSSATNGATISDSQGVGTITNDDTAPSFSINNATVSEGGTLTFTVTKSGSTALSHNVNYATANGSATTADYTAKSGTLSFTSGQTSKTVTVNTTQESINEHSETLYVNLSSATSGATISDSQGVGTITNDDNIAPVANNDSVTASQAEQFIVNVVTNDTDANGDTLTLTSVNYAACTIYSSTSLDCNAGPSGTRNFTYTISDGFGGTATGTVTLTVQGGGGGGFD